MASQDDEEVTTAGVRLERHEDLAFGEQARGASLWTSTAEGDDGSSYVAGVFSGMLVVGGVMLTSHGGDDVFVARLRPRGSAMWAQAIGGKQDEADPKVSFDDGRVTVVGMTGGAVDCGDGPIDGWTSRTFFVCTFDPDGRPRSGGTFPTGTVGRPSLVRADATCAGETQPTGPDRAPRSGRGRRGEGNAGCSRVLGGEGP